MSRSSLSNSIVSSRIRSMLPLIHSPELICTQSERVAELDGVCGRPDAGPRASSTVGHRGLHRVDGRLRRVHRLGRDTTGRAPR